MSTRPRLIMALFVSALVVASAFGVTAEAAQLRVLIFSGRNNHNWKATTPALKKILEDSGRFAVDVTNDPSKCDAATFAKYDVIVSNWGGYPQMNERQWGPKTEKAFLDFVRSGKGFALFHAASASFHTWPEFQQISGATWGKGTGHGAYHAFKVTIADKNHPVTRGMQDFLTTDELWHRMPRHPKAHAICTAFSAKDKGGSGDLEPVVICTQLGKGRGFNLVLGHDVKAMQNVGWKTLMLRGTEWAATGKVTVAIPANWPAATRPTFDVDAMLKAIAGYEFGQSRKPTLAVERLTSYAAIVPATRKMLAPKMAKMLSSNATLECKKFLCVQLSLIGSDEQVPTLAALLADKELSLAARAALARMPGEQSLVAMRAAMAKSSGQILVGLINSLGERRDAKAAAAIAKHLASSDIAVAGAAVDALGKIGGTAAVKALSAAGARLPAKLQQKRADALLKCADKLLAAGNTSRARVVYTEMSAPDKPKHIRTVAFPGLVAGSRDDAAKLILEALTGSDRAMHVAAIRCARMTGDTSLTKILADNLKKFPSSVQAQLINALADRGDSAALPAITAAARSADANIRRAALAALGRLGNASTVPVLAEAIGKASGAELEMARAGLVTLKGKDVDAAIVAQMRKSQPSVRRELIAALNARGSRSAVPALLKAAGDEDRQVRKEAFKALSKLADAAASPTLIGMLRETESTSERRDIENTIVTIGRRTGSIDRTVSAIVAEISRMKGPVRTSLIRMLGKFGGPKALQAVRAAVKDGDAGVRTAGIRALSEWADASPLEDLLAIARSERGMQPKVLALRGFAALTGKAKDKSPEQMAKLFAEALKLASRPDEKKALLGALGQVHSLGAMQQAMACLKDPALVNEAGLAAVQIAGAIWPSHRPEAKAAMNEVLAACKTPAVKEKASAILVQISKPLNLARGATATSPDGLDKDGGAGGDQAAIDGNPNTYWDEVDGQKLYRLKIELKAPAEVSAVSILGYNHHSYAPKDFEILCDDKVVKTVKNATYKDNKLLVTFPKARCKTLELKITGYYPSSPAIRELQIYNLK